MKRIITYLIIILCIFSSIVFAEGKDYLNEFSDVSTWHWAYETIQKLSSKGIISGYPDGSFKPSNTITRAEATKIIMAALEPNGVFPYPIEEYPDVPTNHWANRYVVNGRLYVAPYDDGFFRPDQAITRLEFSNAVAKCIKNLNYTIESDTNTDTIELTDIDNLNEEDINNIKLLIKLGIINGYEDKSFRPNNFLTRAEACKVLSLSLIYKDKGLDDVISQTTSWYELDTVSGWHNPLQFDNEGNIKYFIRTGRDGNSVNQIYYNGQYFMTPNAEVKTMKKEKLYTPDGKEWDVKWFGGLVVEYVVENGKYKVIDHYQEKEYSFDTEYITAEDAINVMKELFPYTKYEFIEKDSNLFYCNEYTPKTNDYMGSMIVNSAFKDSNDQIWISVEELREHVWSEEVNGNTKSKIDMFNELEGNNGNL